VGPDQNPQYKQRGSALNGIEALSPTDIWSAGATERTDGGHLGSRRHPTASTAGYYRPGTSGDGVGQVSGYVMRISVVSAGESR
jgi:hypothetical protein